MEIRNLFKDLFEKNNNKFKKYDKINLDRFKLLSGDDILYSKNKYKNVYANKVARTSIDRIATYMAKIIPQHIKGEITNKINGDINNLISVRPNEIMTRYDFIYKVISQLYTYNNAFIFIKKDKEGFITGFYPILSSEIKLLEDKNGDKFIRFKFKDSQVYTLPYDEIIHLKRFYNENDIFGTTNEILETNIETYDTTIDGINKSIKLTNSVRGILQTDANLKQSDTVDVRERFVKDFIGRSGKGIACLDTSSKFTPINITPINISEEQIKRISSEIYDYFGISEGIIRNQYNEEEYNSFIQGVIEPLSIQLEEAFSTAIFTDRAIKQGHRISFYFNRLSNSSLETKAKILNLVAPIGSLSVDEIRETIGFKAIGGEQGQKVIQSLNNIDSTIANDYQLGKQKGDEE